MDQKAASFWQKWSITSSSITIGVGGLFLTLFFFGCESNAKESIDDHQAVETKIDEQYLEKSIFPFEILSSKAYIGEAVKANDKVVLSYELEMVNAYRNSIFISKIEVVDYEKDQVLATFDSTYLLLHLLRPGVRNFEEVLEMKTSALGIANLWLELDEVKIPKNIFHRITFKLKDRQGKLQEANIDLALVEFPEQTDLTIGLPFHKGKWFYIANAHRDVRLITEGNPTFPQRYAIDWAALTEQCKFELDSSKSIEMFKTYKEDLLAVSDAKVVFVKDSIPENDPFGNTLAVQITRETVGGNYVVLDIGNGIYAFYAHLVPGSLTVKVGDEVKKGEVIGQLGNSGNSNGPHLHFHLETKSKYPLGGEGVPYVFEGFKQLASYDDNEIDSILSFSNIPLPLSATALTKMNQLPVGNGVVEF